MFKPHFQRTTVEQLASGKKHPWLSGRPPTRAEVILARRLIRRRAQSSKIEAAKSEAPTSPPKDKEKEKKDEASKTTTGTAQTDVKFCYHVCACHKVDDGPWNNNSNAKAAQPDKKNAKDNQGTKQDASNKDTSSPPSTTLPPHLPPSSSSENAQRRRHVRFDLDTKDDSEKADSKNKTTSNQADTKPADKDSAIAALLQEIIESKNGSREALIREQDVRSNRQALEMQLLEQDLQLLEARKEDTRVALDWLAEQRASLLNKVKSWQKEHDNGPPRQEINKRIREHQDEAVREASAWMSQRDDQRRLDLGWFEFEDRANSSSVSEFSELHERVKSLSTPPISDVLKRLDAWELKDENVALPGMKYSHGPSTPITITVPARVFGPIHAFKKDNKIVDTEGREILILESPPVSKDAPRRTLRRKPGGILKRRDNDNNNESLNSESENKNDGWKSDVDNNNSSSSDENNNNSFWSDENKDSDSRSSFSRSRDGSRSPSPIREEETPSWFKGDKSNSGSSNNGDSWHSDVNDNKEERREPVENW